MSRRPISTRRRGKAGSGFSGFSTMGGRSGAFKAPRQTGAFAGKRRASRQRLRRRNVRTGGFLGIEHKFYDQAKADTALTAPTDAAGGEFDPVGAIQCLNAVTQGDGESSRDGRQIRMTKIQVNGILTHAAQVNQVAGDLIGEAMVALVLDTQTNAAQLNSEDVFDNHPGLALGACVPMRNMQLAKRFKVLKRQVFAFPQVALSWDGTNMEQNGSRMSFQWNVDLNNIAVNYTGTTEAIANITDNSLHIIAYDNTGLSSLAYGSRLRFVG